MVCCQQAEVCSREHPEWRAGSVAAEVHSFFRSCSCEMQNKVCERVLINEDLLRCSDFHPFRTILFVMLAWNCCECFQYSLSASECLICKRVPEAVFVPGCNVVYSSESLSACLVLLLPQKGNLIQSVLHIGLVDTRGKVLELREDGVRYRYWRKKKRRLLLEISLSPVPSNWDLLLRDHMERERESVFDKKTNNCLDFVVRMLNRNSVVSSVPLSRHEVSGLLLAPSLGRYMLQRRLKDKFSTRRSVLLIRPAVMRGRVAAVPALLCDLCDKQMEPTTRSCRRCRSQVCSLCVFLHVCIPCNDV